MGNKLTRLSIQPPTFSHIWFDVKPIEMKRNDNDDQNFIIPPNYDNLEILDDDPELQCEEYIRNINLDKMLIFIANEKTASYFIERIHSYSQIKAIFIVSYDIDTKNALEINWLDFMKVRIVLINELINRMNSFKSRWLRNAFEQIPFESFDLTKARGYTSTELNGDFLTSQHLIHVLLNLKSSINDKDQFIEQCTKVFRKYNSTSLKDIRDFRNSYMPSEALTYYTKPAIFFQLVNTALRTRDVELLFLVRFFIRDIFDRLIEKQCQHPVHVYRGQRMQREERQKLKRSIGQAISVNSFWSTSLNRKVANQYLGDTKIQPNEISEEYVIFEIYADPKCSNKPFAIIEKNSAISEEQEVLFGAGAIFYLKNVRCEKQDEGHHPIWIFEMELGNEDEYELNYLLYRVHYNYTNDEIIPLTLSSFGLILCNLEKYKFAYKLFQRILRDRSSMNLIEQARCEKIMGRIASAQHHYWQSLHWYKNSLITYAMIDSNIYSAEIASVYDGIGHIHVVRKQYKRAHRSYQKSLSIWEMYYGEDQDHEEIAFCYISEARVYLLENSLEQASVLSRKGLSILYECNRNTPIHPNLAFAHCLLGDVLAAMRMYDLAIDHYIESFTIAKKTLSQDEGFLFSIYSDLQIVCEKAERNFDQLLIDNTIQIMQDQIRIDHYNKNNGTSYQMTFRCPRCHQWQWIFTIFRPIKRFVCTGCWRKRCPRLMSFFRVLT